MSEMVERVSRAIAPEAWLALDRGLIRDEAQARAGLLATGRAAIEAMREPSRAMLKAKSDCEGYPTKYDQWRAMIDAALTSTPHPSS